MLLKLLIGFIVMVLLIGAFFVYETVRFNNYISRSFENSFNIPVNHNAPVLTVDTVEIAAPVDIVWKTLTQINEWPEWQKNVTQATLLGDLQEGTQFTWKAGGFSFQSQIHTIKFNNRFGWTGTTFGANAIHNWKFESREDITIVSVEESLQGVFPVIFRTYFQNSLDQGVKDNLTDLKLASEAT